MWPRSLDHPCRIRANLRLSASPIRDPLPGSYPLTGQADRPGTVSVADRFFSHSATSFLTGTHRVAIVPRPADKGLTVVAGRPRRAWQLEERTSLALAGRMEHG